MTYKLTGPVELTYDSMYGHSIPERFAFSPRVKRVYHFRGDGTVNSPGRGVRTLTVDKVLRVDRAVYIDSNNDYRAGEDFDFTEEHGWTCGSYSVVGVDAAIAAFQRGAADGVAIYSYAGELHVYPVCADVLTAIAREPMCYKHIGIARKMIPDFEY